MIGNYLYRRNLNYNKIKIKNGHYLNTIHNYEGPQTQLTAPGMKTTHSIYKLFTL